MAFGLQNSVIALTPTGRIDSAYLDGADGSDVTPAWNVSDLNLASLQVGTALSIDLVANGYFTDPGSPSSELGFNFVFGQPALDAGFSFSGTVLSNSCTLATSGAFRLVAVRNGISVVSSVITFVISAPAGVDNVSPTVPTGITATPGSAAGTIAITCDQPSDMAPGATPASGTAHVDVLVDGSIASPPSPLVSPANSLAAPTVVNIGSMTIAPALAQSGKVWTAFAEGSGIASTASEQCLFYPFGQYNGAQQFCAKLDPYTSSAANALNGLMVHETGVAGGKFVAIGLGPSNGAVGLYVISRSTSGGSSSQVATQLEDANGQSIIGPVYVFISRAADGKTWTFSYASTEIGRNQITVQTLSMNASVQYGGFLTSQSAGTTATAHIEEISITSGVPLTGTVTASSPVSIQFQSVDSAGNTSALSTAIQGIPKTQTTTTGAIVWKPGIRIRIGGYANMQSLASIKSSLDSVIALDVNNQIKGICISPTWAQLEGPTLGQYDNFGSENGFTKIGALINLLKSYSPPRDLTIEVNGGGNGYSPPTSAPSNFCPTYMQNSTYGGGMTWQGLDRPYICIWNQNVANRLIALFAAYYTQFGPDTPTGGIYRWDPYQEFSINAGAAGYSTSALSAVWPSLMAGLRSAAPKSVIFVKPTYVNPNDGSAFPALLQAAQDNFISWGTEDCADTRSDWGQKAYLGQWASTPVDHTTANGGNPDWDYHCNVDPAELWLNSNGSAAIPPATYGSGLIYDGAPTHPGIWTRVKTMKATHVDIYVDAFGGPNVNRRTYSSSAPANPTPGPGAGLVAAHPNIIDVLTGNTAYSGVIADGCAMPWTDYPTGWPQ